jgi:hypothetical protein
MFHHLTQHFTIEPSTKSFRALRPRLNLASMFSWLVAHGFVELLDSSNCLWLGEPPKYGHFVPLSYGMMINQWLI